MLWDLIQQSQIAQAKLQSQHAKAVAADAHAEIRFLKIRLQKLEEAFDRLTMSTMAIAEILCEQGQLSEEAVEAKIEEIDLRDGALDGRLRQPAAVSQCAKCRHANSARRCKCLYCGEPLPARSTVFPPGSIEPPNGGSID
ncbi:hypothetical protein [Schlesneria sp. DSM 10557]|uniref:hypothetical protein n=1 Tax=Schlesneria sp. DSM 10557 TaxID=3044399 RepID=UPI00359FB2BF